MVVGLMPAAQNHLTTKMGNPEKVYGLGAKLAGASGCDKSYKGAYGSTVVLMKNISKYCSNCTEKVLLDAGIYADDQLIRVTNQQASEDILNDLYR